MKLKICGMKYLENIQDIANLQPDYLGFIFYDKSPRFFDEDIPDLSNQIKKVGVFVDATIDYILEMVNKHKLKVVQLHGTETPEFCNTLQQENIVVIKVFSIKNEFNFDTLKPFEQVCDYFLFDTKGKLPGGNGYAFNWDVLNDYPSTKPYFLSGGIGIDSLKKLKAFKQTEASKYCYTIDVNSKFETGAGLKNVELLKIFKSQI